MYRFLFILFFLFGWDRIISVPESKTNLNIKRVPLDYNITGSDHPMVVNFDSLNSSLSRPSGLKRNNPGNLKCFDSGEFRVFNTIEEGYEALLHDLRIKISGRSIWTDSSTTISDFIKIYAPDKENDTRACLSIFCEETGLQATNKLFAQFADVLARGIIKMENISLFNKMYFPAIEEDQDNFKTNFIKSWAKKTINTTKKNRMPILICSDLAEYSRGSKN